MGFSENLKSFDSHSTVSNEFRVRTVHGAILSVVTIVAICYLVISEYRFNFQTTVLEKVHVSEMTLAGLEMEFDVTLHSVPCAILSIDANDPTGQAQSLHLDKRHHVWKHRMSKTGRLIGSKRRLELGSTLLSEEHLKEQVENVTGLKEGEEVEEADIDVPAEECGSCFGAGEEGECCDTCDDVKRAYKRKGWVLRASQQKEIPQCKQMLTSADEKDEGCNVHGRIALSTGGGNVHLAPSRDLENSPDATNFFSVFLQTFEQFNVSHTVKKIRFGDEFPGHIHQLDGEERVIEDGYGMYQYYIQVVPTLYKWLNGTEMQTNQYSVTEHMRHVTPGSGRGLPGVFFFYEVSPLHVEIEEYKRGWVSFFTSVAAIVGGVITFMGMIDKYMFMTTAKSKQLLR